MLIQFKTSLFPTLLYPWFYKGSLSVKQIGEKESVIYLWLSKLVVVEELSVCSPKRNHGQIIKQKVAVGRQIYTQSWINPRLAEIWVLSTSDLQIIVDTLATRRPLNVLRACTVRCTDLGITAPHKGVIFRGYKLLKGLSIWPETF